MASAHGVLVMMKMMKPKNGVLWIDATNSTLLFVCGWPMLMYLRRLKKPQHINGGIILLILLDLLNVFLLLLYIWCRLSINALLSNWCPWLQDPISLSPFFLRKSDFRGKELRSTTHPGWQSLSHFYQGILVKPLFATVTGLGWT